MAKSDTTPLLERLGGESGCKRLSQSFYSRVASNDELKPFFPGKSMRCATEELAAFLIQFLGGDEDKTQYRWWLSLHESHARFTISESQRRAWLTLMGESIKTEVSDTSTQLELARFFELASSYITDLESNDKLQGDLNECWNQQLALDQLIDNLKNEKDIEVIKVASRFTPRPSVFVGISARMMETKRNQLIEFVQGELRKEKRLGISRFNGRTMLHYAARWSCVPIIRQLLEDGVDPNVLDSGGHTALYRSAAGESSEKASLVVAELVGRGANVDHAGGVNRSTALHEAARHGNLAVAKALLDFGANTTVKDRKGLTPLDRARNLKRSELAKLLCSRLKS